MVTQTAVSRFCIPVLFGCILAMGTFLRIANLDGPSFSLDEILHTYSARQVLDGQPPALPSGVPYARALLFTQLVAISSGILGLDEFSARLPSVIAGCLTIVLVFAISRRWFSNGAALVAAFLTAIMPIEIAFSREARMYALFQLFYVCFIFILFQGLEGVVPKQQKTVPQWITAWNQRLQINSLLLASSLAFLLLALHTHRLMLIAVTGPAVYVIALAILSIWAGRRLGLPRGKYAAAAAAVIVAGLTVYAVYPEQLNNMREIARYVPEWAANNVRWSYYYDILADQNYLLIQALVCASIIALARNPKATLYLFTCFAFPLLIQSFLFSWKHERYIFHLLPLMYILFAAGFSIAASHLYQRALAWANHALTRRWAATAAFILVVSAFVLPSSSLRTGLTLYRNNYGTFAGVYHPNWRAATQFVASQRGTGDVVIASAPGIAMHYGLQAPIYFLANDSTDIDVNINRRDTRGRVLDYIAGAPMILDFSTLDKIFSEHKSGWVITEKFRFYGSRRLPSIITGFIEKNCSRQDLPKAPDMVIWRWPKLETLKASPPPARIAAAVRHQGL